MVSALFVANTIRRYLDLYITNLFSHFAFPIYRMLPHHASPQTRPHIIVYSHQAGVAEDNNNISQEISSKLKERIDASRFQDGQASITKRS